MSCECTLRHSPLHTVLLGIAARHVRARCRASMPVTTNMLVVVVVDGEEEEEDDDEKDTLSRC